MPGGRSSSQPGSSGPTGSALAARAALARAAARSAASSAACWATVGGGCAGEDDAAAAEYDEEAAAVEAWVVEEEEEAAAARLGSARLGGGRCLTPVMAEMSMNCAGGGCWPGGATLGSLALFAAARFSASAWRVASSSIFRFMCALLPAASRLCASPRSRSSSCLRAFGSWLSLVSLRSSRSFLIFLANFFFSSLRHLSTPESESFSLAIGPCAAC